MSDTELKPCPFCGGKAWIGQGGDDGSVCAYWCFCFDCATESQHFSSQEMAIDAWNRRVTEEKKQVTMTNREFYKTEDEADKDFQKMCNDCQNCKECSLYNDTLYVDCFVQFLNQEHKD